MSEDNKEKKIPLKKIDYQVDTVSVRTNPQFYIRKKNTSNTTPTKPQNTQTKQPQKNSTQPKNSEPQKRPVSQQRASKKANNSQQSTPENKQQTEASQILNILAYFNPHNNTMTVNYDEETKKEKKSEDIIVHEAQHSINYKKGLYQYPMSPENVYKMNMYDEISATTATLVSLRQKYLETKDTSVFDVQSGRFSYYKNAVISGEIRPGSNNQEDFDKEMKFIANETQAMWQKRIAPSYAKQNAAYARDYSDKFAEYYKYDDENYKRGKQKAMNIGGVDFSQYLEKDVEIPEEGKMYLSNMNYTYKTIRKNRENEEKRAGKYSGPQNKPINPVEYLSFYREWEDKDGSRVSPVMEMEIPDMTADYIQKPTKSYAENENNSTDLKSTLQTQAAKRTAKIEENSSTEINQEQLKTQLQKASEEYKQQKQKPAYQYSQNRPLNEQLQEAAASSKTVNIADNTEELDRVREKAAKQTENRESDNEANSQTKQAAQNAPNAAIQNNTGYIMMMQRQNGRN